MKYYHYTTITSLEQILVSDRLKASWSTGSDAALGDGVYFTRMSPNDYSMEEIFLNNWARPLRDDGRDRMDVCLEIENDGRNMTTDRSVLGQRDVWLYQGEDMAGLGIRVSRIYINVANKASWSTKLRQLLSPFSGRLYKLAYPTPQAEDEQPTESPTLYASQSYPVASSSSSSSTSLSNPVASPSSSSSLSYPVAAGGGGGGGGGRLWGLFAAAAATAGILGGAMYLSSQPNREHEAEYDDN